MGYILNLLQTLGVQLGLCEVIQEVAYRTLCVENTQGGFACKGIQAFNDELECSEPSTLAIAALVFETGALAIATGYCVYNKFKNHQTASNEYNVDVVLDSDPESEQTATQRSIK